MPRQELRYASTQTVSRPLQSHSKTLKHRIHKQHRIAAAHRQRAGSMLLNSLRPATCPLWCCTPAHIQTISPATLRASCTLLHPEHKVIHPLTFFGKTSYSSSSARADPRLLLPTDSVDSFRWQRWCAICACLIISGPSSSSRW
eukprot:scaffold9625_cov21-Tisochrysis_lutea.AAC.1